MAQSEIISNSASSTSSASPHRNKALLAWLACLFGIFGAHAWYLGRPLAWLWTLSTVVLMVLAHLHVEWWNNPFFLLLAIPMTAASIEALIFALTSDEKFDERYNPGSARRTHTGWNAVFAAIAAGVLGSMFLVYVIAQGGIYLYATMGWLDGYHLQNL